MKKYFITGVSGGLGLELMKQLVAQGEFVYGVSRNNIPEDKALIESKDKWVWHYCDIALDDEIQKTLAHQKSIDFLPDVVILNAGEFKWDEAEFDLDGYQQLYKVNCRGALRWVQTYLKIFEEKNSGHFVYISSLASCYPFPFQANYSASKAYTSMVFECLRKRYVNTKLHFSVFYPGIIKTEMSEQTSVPNFLKLPVSKAAKLILTTIPKGGRSVCFPLRSLLFKWLQVFIPSPILLSLANKKYQR